MRPNHFPFIPERNNVTHFTKQYLLTTLGVSNE